MMLAAQNGLGNGKYEQFAKDMMETCYQMYAKMPTGLSPEIAYFNTHDGSSKDIIVKVNFALCSIFYLMRLRARSFGPIPE